MTPTGMRDVAESAELYVQGVEIALRSERARCAALVRRQRESRETVRDPSFAPGWSVVDWEIGRLEALETAISHPPVEGPE